VSVGSRPRAASQLVGLFNATFEQSDRTVLQGGAGEPYYVPGEPHRIFFREDFIRSALHEVAHWCVAGVYRRALPDYGYWYSPDGRDACQQKAFFAVEARPQAIERCFCDAIGIAFSPSIDNVGAHIEPEQLRRFEARIQEWCNQFERIGLPLRAARFTAALRATPSLSHIPVPECAA
jgi:elongation factor P hydroxylase